MIQLLLVLLVVGVVLYVIETYIPMSPPIKILIRLVIIVAVVLWMLQIFGIVGPPVPRLR